jgi:hypothetical protein
MQHMAVLVQFVPLQLGRIAWARSWHSIAANVLRARLAASADQ